MNPYVFLYYCSFVMNRKLASKSMRENVPDSAVYFLNGMVLLFVGAISYYIGGPPPRKQFVFVVVLAILYVIATFNNFIFMKKDRYKNIVEYYDSKYSSRPPWFTYFTIPACYILLMYLFSLIHDHYA
jgi:phosphoglycerol transferase MdoB-like AlkP superfamily enzyme